MSGIRTIQDIGIMVFKPQNQQHKQTREGRYNETGPDATSVDNIPVEVLTQRLAVRRGGAQLVRILGNKKCRTVADVMRIRDDEWRRVNGLSPNALAILREELETLIMAPSSSYMAETSSQMQERIPEDVRGQTASFLSPQHGQVKGKHRVQSPSQGDNDAKSTGNPSTQAIDSSMEWRGESSLQRVSRAITERHSISYVDTIGGVPVRESDRSEPVSVPEQSTTTSKVVISAWSEVPVTALIQRLALRQGGARVCRALHDTRCRTMADVVNRTDDQWLSRRGFGQTSLGILNEELAALKADYVLFSPVKSPEPTTPPTNVSLDENDQSSSADTLWAQIEDRLQNPASEHLKSIRFGAVAANIQSVRTRNALLRHLPRGCTLYDLVMRTEEQLLQTPNFGRKSLHELKLEIVDILNHLPPPEDVILPAKPLAGLSNIEKSDIGVRATADAALNWLTIPQYVATYLSPREVEIVKAYYGFFGTDETLASVGQRLELTRERVRQIKQKAARKFTPHVSVTIAARAFRDYAAAKLETAGIKATTRNLLDAPNNLGVVGSEDSWLLAWFEDVYGRNWYSNWVLANAPVVADDQEAAELPLLSTLVQFLRSWSYRPMTLEEMLAVAQAHDYSISAYDLLIRLEEHPEVRLFTHGDMQIGHVSWRWFDPQRARASRRAEWALRLMHVPASALEIARVIRDRLGILDVSTFSVAEACERESGEICEQEGLYGLILWEKASALRQPLAELLVDGPLLLTEIADIWGTRYNSEFEPELVMAALHTNPDSFYTVKPLCWASKEAKSTSGYDPSSFTFENLMPTL